MDSKIKEVYLSKDCRSSSLVFWGCEKLKKVTLEDGIKKISYGMFKETAIKSITIPGSVKNIGERAFANCKKLQKATINEGVKKISKEAFSCTTLEEITIPSTVTELGKKCFPLGIYGKVIVEKSSYPFQEYQKMGDDGIWGDER